MNKIIARIFAAAMIIFIIGCCVLIPLWANRKIPKDVTVTLGDTTASDTTLPDVSDIISGSTTDATTEPPTFYDFYNENGVRVWDDHTDEISLVAANKVQLKITNSTTLTLVVTPADMIMNGKEYIAEDNFDEPIAPNSTVIYTITFDVSIDSLSFSLIFTDVGSEEITDYCTSDTITIRVGE